MALITKTAVGEEKPLMDLKPWVAFDKEGNRHFVLTAQITSSRRTT